MPEEVVWSVSITAVLKYRSAPQELIDRLLGGEFEVPVVEMTQDSRTIGDEDKSIPGFWITFPVLLGLLLLLISMRGNKK